ncbi:MAG: glycosyltransferase family 2 protein [Minisyncoccia bacterium]
MAEDKLEPGGIPEYEISEFSQKKNKWCLCVFVLNEGDRIRKQLIRTLPYSRLVDVIIADGGSGDNSTPPDFLVGNNVRTFLKVKNEKGLGSQMRMAFDYALRDGYEGVIVMDGNNKDNPSAISRFIKSLEDGADHVQGSRFLLGGLHVNTPWERIWGVRLIHAPLISLAAGFRYTDTTNGFRAYSARFLNDLKQEIFKSVFSEYQLHYYLAIRAPRLGYKTKEIPVEREYPKAGPTPTKIGGWKGKLLVLENLFSVCLGDFNPPKKTSFLRRCGAVLLISVALAAWYGTMAASFPNIFHFQVTSEEYVLRAIRLVERGIYQDGGFLTLPLGGPYLSQYGIQLKILEIFRAAFGGIVDYIALVKYFFVFLFSLVMGMYIYTIQARIGRIAGVILFCSVFISPWLIFFSPNVYWMSFGLFLPFVAGWVIYPKFREKKTIIFYLAVFCAILFRELAGYEYVTNVILSAAVPVVYFEVLVGTKLKDVLKKIGAVILAGFFGMVVAMALHAYQGYLHFGGVNEVAAYVEQRAAIHTIEAPTKKMYWDPVVAIQYVITGPLKANFESYTPFPQPIAFLLGSVPFLLGVFLFWKSFGKRFNAYFKKSAKARAFRAATAYAILATLSWPVLAWGHMVQHIPFNAVLFYLPGNLMLVVFIWVFICVYVRSPKE